MKILYLVPGVMKSSKLGAQELERRRRILQEMAFEGTVVDADDAGAGPLSIELMYEEFLSVPGSVERAVRAQEEGYDGVLLGCYADPGMDALREMLSIPVAGPFEASCYLAMTMGRRFSIITVTPEMCVPLEDEALAKGVAAGRLASVRAIDIDVLDLADDPQQLKQRLLEQGRLCLADGADTLVLGCISLAFSGMDRVLEQELGVPCINPIAAALKNCEGMVSMGLCHSKRAYPLPHKMRK